MKAPLCLSYSPERRGDFLFILNLKSYFLSFSFLNKVVFFHIDLSLSLFFFSVFFVLFVTDLL